MSDEILIGDMVRLILDRTGVLIGHWRLRRAVQRGHVTSVSKLGHLIIFRRRNLDRVINELQATGYLDAEAVA